MPNMSRRKRRSQLEITIDILDKVNTNQVLAITRLMMSTGLSFKQLGDYLEMLQSKKYIIITTGKVTRFSNIKSTVIEMTAEGVDLLRKLQELQKQIDKLFD